MADYYGGITGEGSCSSGKTCGPGAAIIPPFTYQQYDAGTRSWGSNDPECGYTASIPALGTDYYGISLSSSASGGTNAVVITPPVATSNLAKAVKATSKMWSYDDNGEVYDIVSVIFYPAWEMSEADAKITN